MKFTHIVLIGKTLGKEKEGLWSVEFLHCHSKQIWLLITRFLKDLAGKMQ